MYMGCKQIQELMIAEEIIFFHLFFKCLLGHLSCMCMLKRKQFLSDIKY